MDKTELQEARRGKLRQLVKMAGGPAQFARDYSKRGQTDKDVNPTYVSQILNGHRAFGERAARTMEESAGLPPYFFDGPDSDEMELLVLFRKLRPAWRGKLLEDARQYLALDQAPAKARTKSTKS